MSQKTVKRLRRYTSDEDCNTEPKSSPINSNGTENISEEEVAQEEKSLKIEETNGKAENEAVVDEVQASEKDESETEQKASENMGAEKNENAVNGNGVDELFVDVEETIEVKQIDENEKEPSDSSTTVETEESDKKTDENADVDVVEMDPLVLSDDADPELIFDENSDLESVRTSPPSSRCQTRRSQNKSVPPPNTPKLSEDAPTPVTVEENGPTPEPEKEDLNLSFESCSENTSTRAEAGSDITRLAYIEKEESGSSFLSTSKNESFSDTLKHLSPRRSIRPMGDVSYKKVLRNNWEKSDLNSVYPYRNSVERVSMGVKRKSDDEIEEITNKRFKNDSPGFFSRFTSPLTNLKNPFKCSSISSTPKLTVYKDDKFSVEDPNLKSIAVHSADKRWCSIM